MAPRGAELQRRANGLCQKTLGRMALRGPGSGPEAWHQGRLWREEGHKTLGPDGLTRAKTLGARNGLRGLKTLGPNGHEAKNSETEMALRGS
jgi:hypothetical protein